MVKDFTALRYQPMKQPPFPRNSSPKTSVLPSAASVWVLVTAFLIAEGWIVARSASAAPLTLAELRAARKEMAARRRRIIFNNDGDDITGQVPFSGVRKDQTAEEAAAGSTPEGLLSVRTAALVGTQVDSIFYHSTFGLRIFHEDGAFRSIYEYPDTQGVGAQPVEAGSDGLATQNCKALMARYGKDSLEVMVDFCRKHDLEIFYSNRMNDVHDWYFPEMLAAIKVRHPEYTLGHEAGAAPAETLKLMRQGRKGSTALNFAAEEVRDLTVEAMRQVCRNYDVDGIELDYFRGFSLFPSPVQPEHVDMLNDMMRKMRRMTEEEGLRRGRPILVAARGINNPIYSLGRGLDVETWLKEDLIDIVMPLHFLKHQRSLRAFINLAHKYNTPAYPCLRRAEHQSSWFVCRGEAMQRFAEGANGVTTFNRFDPTSRRWRELGDPNVLAGLGKTYAAPEWDGFVLTEKGCHIPLLIPEDLTAPPPASLRVLGQRQKRTVTLRTRVSELTSKHAIRFRLNGTPLEPTTVSPAIGDKPQTIRFEFAPNLADFKVPENVLRVTLGKENGTVQFYDLELDVVYED